MTLLWIKYGFIILCSVYTTICLTNKRQTISSSRAVIRAVFVVLQAVLVAYTRQYSISIGILTMVLSSAFIDKILLKLNISTAILSTVISYGSSYILYAGGLLVTVLVKIVIGDYSNNVSAPYFAIIGIVQTLLSVLLFQTKRLRHGLPFLQNSNHSVLGVYLSISLLVIVSIFGTKTETYRITMILFYSLLSLGALLWYWGKHYLTHEYLDQLQKREQKKLEEALEASHQEINKLKIENQTFSKIIHKDNKIIPAMELAVSQLLFSLSQDEDQKIRVEQARNLLEQLKTLSQERAGIIHNYEAMSQKLPSLGLSGLDALFCFMMQKANMAGIAFDVQVDEGADKTLIQNISDSDACTLLADLVENALIAAGHSQQEKAVQVELGTNGGVFHIRVCDSGDLIPTEVLERWGKERITTHADTGGSGIGMMTIHELCQKYNASFYTQPLQDMLPYHKYICIQFDGLCTFQAH